jgi:hypothetical protein
VLQAPNKLVADFKVSDRMKSVFLSTLSLNTISVYFASLESLNFDETVDTVPTSDNQQPVGSKADVDMR